MHGRDDAFAWRLYGCNWLVIGLMSLALVGGLALRGFSVAPDSLLGPGLAVASCTAAGLYWSIRLKGGAMPLQILGSAGQLLLIAALCTPLTYVAASLDLPMQDTRLAALDAALGLDWRDYFQWMTGSPMLVAAAVFSYAMIGWPVVGVPLALGLARRYQRLQEFTLAVALSLVATTLISILVPAMGTYDFFGVRPDPLLFTPGAYLQQVHDLPLVRSGALRALDLTKLTGIITFPSFHACAAVLIMWAFWSVRWTRIPALLLYGAMLCATPLIGGHYFVDLAAGFAVAAVSIGLARALAGRIAQRAPAFGPALKLSSNMRA
jgi:hypothetical protein